MIRLIAGFLFAIVIIVIGHFGMWLLAANHAQEKFVAALEGLPNVTLDYKRIVPKGYPQNIQLEVRGLNLAWQSPQQKNGLSIYLPKVTVQTPLFDMRKAIVTLSREFDIEISHDHKQMRSFGIVSEGARFSSFIRPDGTAEHAFNMANLSVWDKSAPESTAPALRTGVGYLVREVPGVRSPVSWRVSVQDAKATERLAGQAFELNRLVAVFGFEQDFFSQYGPELLPVFSTASSQRQKAKRDLAEKLATTTLEPHIVIDSMQIEKDENWVSLRGAFGLNNKEYLDGRLSLNANDLVPVVQFMRRIGLINTPSELGNERIVNAVRDVTRGNMSIIFERDRAYINSEHVSRASTLKELLTQE